MVEAPPDTRADDPTRGVRYSEWRPAQSHHIFIYSMTLDERLKLRDPAVNAMVEIFEPRVLLSEFGRLWVATVAPGRTP